MGLSGFLQFTDYLKMLPSGWVFEKFISSDDSSRKILSSSMIDEEVARFVEPDKLRERFLSLSDSDQLTCALVYLCGDIGYKVTDFSGLDNVLILSFLVHAASNRDNEINLFGFHEFRESLLPLMVSILEHASVKSEVQEHHQVWQYQCVNDIVLTTALVAQNALKKRKNGSLARVSSLQLKKVTDVLIPPKNDSDDYVTKIILEYCLNEKLIFQNDSEYFFNKQMFSSWVIKSDDEKMAGIRDFALHYNGGIWTELFLKLLDNGAYFSTQIFPLHLQDVMFDILLSLKFTSDVTVKSLDGKNYFCKAEKIAVAQNTSQNIIVMPDFSVIMTHDINSLELYKLSQTGNITGFDKVYKGKIDKTVLCDSLSRGTEGTMVLDWLTKWNAPANVIETVREWSREFYRLYITDRHMLISSDEKVTYQINSYEPLRNLLEPINANALFIIRRGNEQAVREILSSLGFDYRMSGQNSETPIISSQSGDSVPVPLQKWTPVVDTRIEAVDTQSMRGTKYGTELKSLDINETVHVIDYAILTGQQLSIDYEGSPYIKEGLYSFKPQTCEKGIDPVVEGEVTKTKSRKRFYIKKIRKIGVVSK